MCRWSRGFNVRGWFQLLDQMADEFLLWWPQGGVFMVSRDAVRRIDCIRGIRTECCSCNLKRIA